MTKSKILLSEAVENKERRFGSDLNYYPAYVVDDKGEEIPALFTSDQIGVAISRAQTNPEDLPERKSFLGRLFGG